MQKIYIYNKCQKWHYEVEKHQVKTPGFGTNIYSYSYIFILSGNLIY